MKKISTIILIVAVAIFLVSIGGIFVHTWSIINSMTKVRVEINDPIIDKYIDEIERVETISSDGLTISSWQYKVDNPKGIVIVTHGMHGMDASSMLDYGMFFKKEGYETFVLDMRAHGYSDGDTIGLGYTEVKDFSALLDWINTQEEYENKPIILYGFSMGGTTAINTAAIRDDVSAVISVSAYESFESQIVDYMKVGGVPSLVISMYKQAFKILLYVKYNVDPIKNSPLNVISEIDPRPILLIHGVNDEQTSVQHAFSLKEKAGAYTELWIIEGKGHFVVSDILEPESSWYREGIKKFLEKNVGN